MAPEQASMGDRGQPRRAFGWRSALRREVSLLLLFKALALALLWWLFFSPPHRTPVDAAAASHRLAVASPVPAQKDHDAPTAGARARP